MEFKKYLVPNKRQEKEEQRNKKTFHKQKKIMKL